MGLSALLFLGGMPAASSNSASGRLVVGWFEPQQRRPQRYGYPTDGAAAGSRAGGTGDSASGRDRGHRGNAGVPGLTVCAVAAAVCALGVPGPYSSAARGGNGCSTGQSVPHFTDPGADSPGVGAAGHSTGVVWTFTLVWLMADNGWSAGSAGALVTLAQVLGRSGGSAQAGGRTASVPAAADPGDRRRGGGGHADAALSDAADWARLGMPAAMIVASVVGERRRLAFTAIAEIASPFWSAARWAPEHQPVVHRRSDPPLFGALIGAAGYPVAFAVCALFPLLAIPWYPSGTPARVREHPPRRVSAGRSARSRWRSGGLQPRPDALAPPRRWTTRPRPGGQVIGDGHRRAPRQRPRPGATQKRATHHRRRGVGDALYRRYRAHCRAPARTSRGFGAGGVDIAAGVLIRRTPRPARSVMMSPKRLSVTMTSNRRIGDHVDSGGVDVLIGHLDVRVLLPTSALRCATTIRQRRSARWSCAPGSDACGACSHGRTRGPPLDTEGSVELTSVATSCGCPPDHAAVPGVDPSVPSLTTTKSILRNCQPAGWHTLVKPARAQVDVVVEFGKRILSSRPRSSTPYGHRRSIAPSGMASLWPRTVIP